MHNKTVVIYKSKTGFAKKYALWISEELGCDIIEIKKSRFELIKDYETIIYGGGLYAMGINGIGFIKKNFKDLKDKNLIVYMTGATPSREEDLNKVWNMNLNEEENSCIRKFYLRGGFDYSKLNRGNKILMSMLKSKLKNSRNASEDEMGMLMAFDKPVDFTDKNNIKELLEYVRGL